MYSFIDKIKNYGLLVLAGLSALLAAMFMYEKRKSEINDALLGERKTDADLAKMDAQIDSNNEKLKQQEEYRQKLEKEKINVQKINIDDVVDFFNKRK